MVAWGSILIDQEVNKQNCWILSHINITANLEGRTFQKTAHLKSLNVWERIREDGKSALVFVKPVIKMNPQYYLNEILQTALKVFDQKTFWVQTWVFQQNSAPTYQGKA